jgi:hypothetical protein
MRGQSAIAVSNSLCLKTKMHQDIQERRIIRDLGLCPNLDAKRLSWRSHVGSGVNAFFVDFLRRLKKEGFKLI